MADLHEGPTGGLAGIDHAAEPWPGFAATPPGFTPLHDGIPQPEAEPTVQDVQSSVEGAPVLDDTNSIEFMGERFRLANNVSLVPLLRFADASRKGLDSDDMKGMAAMYRMIRGIIHRPALLEPEKIESPPESGVWMANPHAGEPLRDVDGERLYDEREWDRFQDHAENMGAEGDELMRLVGKAMGVISARPRQRRAVSSTPSPTTSPSSRESSSSPDTIPGAGELTDVRTLGR